MHRKSVCMGCKKRHIGCHTKGNCQEWDEENAKHQQELQAYKADKQIGLDFNSVIFDSSFIRKVDRERKRR